MPQMVMGVFSDRAAADRAIAKIRDSGYDTKDISVLVRDQIISGERENPAEKPANGAVAAGVSGAVVGGLAGLLVGVGAIVVPGLGGLFIGGPLAAALGLTGAAATTAAGAATGAMTGGLLGGLVGLGLPEEEAKVYEKKVREGAVVVAVPLIEKDPGVRDMMKTEGAEEIRTVNVPE